MHEQRSEGESWQETITLLRGLTGTVAVTATY